MNQVNLIRMRQANKNKLDTSSWRNIDRIAISVGNSDEHNLAIHIGFLLIKNGTPAKRLPEYFEGNDIGQWATNIRNFVAKAGCKYDHDWERPIVVTEAKFKNGREADIFILDTGEIVEFVETSEPEPRGPEDRITVYL